MVIVLRVVLAVGILFPMRLQNVLQLIQFLVCPYILINILTPLSPLLLWSHNLPWALPQTPSILLLIAGTHCTDAGLHGELRKAESS